MNCYDILKNNIFSLFPYDKYICIYKYFCRLNYYWIEKYLVSIIYEQFETMLTQIIFTYEHVHYAKKKYFRTYSLSFDSHCI